MNTKLLKKLAKGVLVAVCALVLCVNLVTLCLDAAGKREALGWMPYQMLAVESGSMEPVFSQGDLILVKEVPYEALAIGDDVTFLSVDGLVTHRIVDSGPAGFITQGVANTIPDRLPMDANSYCGKCVAVLPGMGVPVQKLAASPAALVLLAALVLVLLLGHPLAKKLWAREAGKKISWLPRAFVSGAALSLLLVMPDMTGAKYVTELRHYEPAVALPMYFSSNYMSDGDGNAYSIQGWNGDPYQLALEVRNYDNSLLYNSDDINLIYGLGLDVQEDQEGMYEVVISQPGADARNTAEAEPDPFPFPEDWEGFEKMTCAIPGGSKAKDIFTIIVQPKGNYQPQPNDRVKFTVHACTSKDETYFITLKGTFELQVAEKGAFLETTTAQDKGGMVALEVTTNLINDGSSEKLVAFHWDPAKMALNEYERTAFNAINLNKEKNYFSREEGNLYMRLQAYSRIQLEFFKLESFSATTSDFVVKVVENITDTLPEPGGSELPDPEGTNPSEPEATDPTRETAGDPEP